MNNTEKILDISKRLKLSHIGSNISCLPILEEIYAKKKPEDIVILDNGHAHLAHLVVMGDRPIKSHTQYGELWQRETPEDSIEKYGIHCDRQAGCDASGGSLGHGIGTGIGYALADRKRDVYVTVSDGSMMEGSNWEALRIAEELRLKNFHLYCNFNGYTAVNEIDRMLLQNRIALFSGIGGRCFDVQFRFTDNTEPYRGVQGHYKTL